MITATEDLTHCEQEIGTIERVHYGKEDNQILTCYIHCVGGWGAQGFGGLALDGRTGPAFLAEVLRVFDVAREADLLGKPCTLYRSRYNQMAEALRGPAGILTIRDFRRKMWPDLKIPTAKEEQLARLQADRARFAERIRELDAEIADLIAPRLDSGNEPV